MEIYIKTIKNYRLIIFTGGWRLLWSDESALRRVLVYLVLPLKRQAQYIIMPFVLF